METRSLSSADRDLIDRASETVADCVDHEKFGGAHIVASTLRTSSGAMYDGVSVPASIGRASGCGEPVAIGSAIADGEDEFDAIAAVSYPMPEHDAEEIQLIPPCGVCREMIVDYGEDIDVIIPREGDAVKVRAEDLLPVRPW